MTRAGSPHSDTLGSQPASRLPEAYRRPPRPSSAPDAKASTERPKKQNTNPTKDKQTTDHTPTTHEGGGARPAPHKEQRYSRPLYRSQPTHPPQHPPAHHQQDTTQATPGRTAPEPDSTPPTPTPPTTRREDPGRTPNHTTPHAHEPQGGHNNPPRNPHAQAQHSKTRPLHHKPSTHRRQTPRSTTPPEQAPAYGRQRPCPPASPPEEKAP